MQVVLLVIILLRYEYGYYPGKAKSVKENGFIDVFFSRYMP